MPKETKLVWDIYLFTFYFSMWNNNFWKMKSICKLKLSKNKGINLVKIRSEFKT